MRLFRFGAATLLLASAAVAQVTQTDIADDGLAATDTTGSRSNADSGIQAELRKLQDGEGGNKPNIIFLLVDDWGSGDVDMCPDTLPIEQCPFRSTTDGRKSVLHTPRIRRMAAEGQILTNFYSPRAICTPSRAGYLSGRDPSRYGMINELFRIMQSSLARGGMPTSEKSVAKYLKELGYSTGYTGKWHLGATNGTHNSAYTPINHGFDFVKFFIEGSNGEQCEGGALNLPDDNNIYHMCSFDHIQDCDPETKECEVVEQPIRWENVTSRQLSVFKEFIEKHKDDDAPFFYQHAFPHVHVPWVPSRHFVTDPTLKLWTDVVGEVDWAVGYILQHLRDLGLDNNTMVVLSSDNGPFLESASSYCPQNCRWLTPEAQETGVPNTAGCTPCQADTVSKAAKNLTGGKGNTWEGGQRVPAIAWWPGRIPAGSVNPVVASGLDLLPTFVSLAGGTLDEGVAYDGNDISTSLLASDVDPAAEPEGSFVYWCGLTINAVRTGRYKTIYHSQDFVGASPEFKTPDYLCAGTGKCCAQGPSRLCTCKWATKHDPPLLIDLLENPQEDFTMALDYSADTNLTRVVNEAESIRKEKLSSVVADRGIEPTESVDEMSQALQAAPTFPETDLCVSLGSGVKLGPWECQGEFFPAEDGFDGCGFTPDACQKTVLPGNSDSFYPFQNCSIAGTYQGEECAKRLPCCQQEGYKGPFEYIKPLGNSWDGDTERCGCFDNGPNSYFPDDEEMQQSVCEWQNDVLAELEANDLTIWTNPKVAGFCRLPACTGMTENNQYVCDQIKKYGLDNVPTGNIFNSPYPDTQDEDAPSSLLYPNQEKSPGEGGKDQDATSRGVSYLRQLNIVGIIATTTSIVLFL